MTPPPFRHRFAQNLWLPLHWAVILATTCFLEYRVGRLLSHHGLSSMVLRNLIAMPVGYLLFLGMVRAWLAVLLRMKPHLFAAEEASPEEELAPGPRAASRAEAPATPSGDWWNILNWVDLSEGVALVFFLLIVAIVFVWILGTGPGILTDTAFDFALSLGLLRSSRGARQGGGTKVLYERTILMFLVVFTLSSVFFGLVEHKCPSAHRLSEAVHGCSK